MVQRYLKGLPVSCYAVKVLLFSCLSFLSFQMSFAQVKDSTITGIYTDFKSYWASSVNTNSSVLPDSSHNLLAFTFRGKTYSTGVNNAILNTKLGSSNYSAQVYKSLPIKSIEGNVVSGNSTYIATAIKNDGDSTKASYTSPYPNIRIADVLTDGKNGLDLGTGVTNLSVGAHISFAIKSLSTKASTDTVPDLIFTQIADPTANKADTIFFYDANGKIVGNKKLVFWNTVSKLGTYKLDLYTLSAGACNTSSINGMYQGNGTRDIRMVAFLLTEFGITNADSVAKVKGIQINPNGTSDQAFIAYNTSILNIDVPSITTQPATQVFCDASSTSATFNVVASSSTTMTYQWKKNGAAITGATSSSYTVNNLTAADTANAYSVTVSNTVGSVTSNNAYVHYVIGTQPSSLYLATGSTAIFSVRSADATAYQWQKGNTNIAGATSSTYTNLSIALNDSGSYRAMVTYYGGVCTTNVVTLKVENLPLFSLQPQNQVLCDASTTTATFISAGISNSLLSFQWYKNGTPIAGATSASLTATGLTLADSNSIYTVKISNLVGIASSSAASLKYIITSTPGATTTYLPTGNPVILSASTSSSATGMQWRKDGLDITGANTASYKIDTVSTTSAGKYTLKVYYTGGFCTTDTSSLTITTRLYSKATGDVNTLSTWGVMPDGSGASPVSFVRPEHTFIMANRSLGANGTNLTISGTYDLGNSIVSVNPGTTLEAGRIIRSQAGGKLAVAPTSSLIVHGKSDLYFDSANKVLKDLTINTTDTVTLHSALHITGGKGHGTVKVTSGVFNTGDSLVLKSDSLGTASVGNSPGTITGKVTIERFIPAHRAWRLFSSPVSDSLAPTIHDAWQEGAVSSTDNPHPGYGTHITYGALTDGFDQNPQHTFSLKVQDASGQWIGVPATNKTKVTDYPAYFFFIRGDRSYDITKTTNNTSALGTTIRTTGYLKQHTQTRNAAAGSTGYALVANPYASPVDFESVYNHSSVSRHMWMWNPNLAGDKGVGAYVLVYWNGSNYSTTPALPDANNLRFLQAYQGFFVESNRSNDSLLFTENDKDTSSLITAFGKEVGAETPRLEINLNVFNDNNTTGVADGVTYLFDKSFNDGVDRDDIAKRFTNMNENAGILSGGKLLAVEQRAMPAEKDSLQLSLTNTKTGSYQLDIIPGKLESVSLYLYDRYTGNKTPLSSTDTNHVKIDINTSTEGSKAANRFVIISRAAAPVAASFAHISATLQPQAIQVDWKVTNENNVTSYTVQRSANGITFNALASVPASGKQSYSYTDDKPLSGINYYRVQSVSRTGAGTFIGVVSEVFSRDVKSSIAIYPNPLTNNHCMIDLRNKTAGKYALTLVNGEGITLFRSSINVSQNMTKQPLLLPASLAKGKYYLKIEGGGKTEVLNLVSLY